MPLTPEDVQNKQFRTVRGPFREGYDEEEVDTFLDEVEVELSRLIGENDTLRQRIEVLQSAPPPQPVQSEAEEMLRRTLLLAQRTADDTVAEARAEAERTVAEARERADATTRQAEERAASALTELERRRQALEQHIEGLRAFEREYRTRLKAYLEAQLRDLDGRPAAEAGEVSSGVTAGPFAGGSPAAPPPPPAAREPGAEDDDEDPAAPPVAAPPTSFATAPFTTPPQPEPHDVDEGGSGVPRLAP